MCGICLHTDQTVHVSALFIDGDWKKYIYDDDEDDLMKLITKMNI